MPVSSPVKDKKPALAALFRTFQQRLFYSPEMVTFARQKWRVTGGRGIFAGTDGHQGQGK